MLESAGVLRHNPSVPIHDEAFSVGNSSVINTWAGPRCEFLNFWIGNPDRGAQGLLSGTASHHINRFRGVNPAALNAPAPGWTRSSSRLPPSS